LNYLYDTAAWKENKALLTAAGKIGRQSFDPNGKLEQKELTEANKNCKTVFYPFSGPDFLNV